MSSNPFDSLFDTPLEADAPPQDPVKRAQALSRAELPQRFYEAVSIAPVDPGGFQIQLDARTVRTPARKILSVENRNLAEAIAAEWDRQETSINPATMPLTRIVNAALDGVSANRTAVVSDIAKFAASDLICYRAEDPERLVERQTALWDPILADIETRFGARFVLAGGIMPVTQPAKSLEQIETALASKSDLELAALHTLTALTGSILLTLALDAQKLSFEAYWDAAHVDEDWNRDLWGEDEEASRRRAQRRQDAEAAAFLLRSAKPGADS